MLDWTVAEAIPVISKAFKERRLLKQRYPKHACVYRGQANLPCAIGVLMTDQEAASLRFQCSPIEQLVEDGIFVVDDLDWFGDVQAAHDTCDWKALATLLEHGPKQAASPEDV